MNGRLTHAPRTWTAIGMGILLCWLAVAPSEGQRPSRPSPKPEKGTAPAAPVAGKNNRAELSEQNDRGTNAAVAPAADPVFEQLQRTLAQLDAERARIASEKVPLAEKVAERERLSIEERRRAEDTRRKADGRSVELSRLRNDIKAREQEQQYLSSLFSEYLRNLETRLHIAEVQLYETRIREARQTLESEDREPRDRLLAALSAVEESVARVESLIGGKQFEGRAAGEDGRLHPGRFILLGPTALFAADSAEGPVGLVEQRLGSLEPSVAPFAEPQWSALAAGMVRRGEGLLPFDASLGNARKIEATRETLAEHIRKGGIVVYPIIGMGFLIAVYSLFKWLALSLVRLPSREKVDAFLRAVRNSNIEEAEQLLNRFRGPAARILAAGWARRDGAKDVIEEAMFAEMLEWRFKFNRGLPFISVGAACAPLLGLLGTVTGIIATFKLITVFGSGDVKMLSAGISEALITTEFGLIVAIPSLLLHAFLARKARALTEKLEQLAIAFIGALSERSPAPPAANQDRAATDGDETLTREPNPEPPPEPETVTA